MREVIGAFVLSLVLASPLAAQEPKLVTEEFMVPAKDPGVQLYVRNKRPEGLTQFTPEKTVIFIHGATYPSETTFDLNVGGFSWMDYIARRGFDVYMVDARGYGKSSRPKEMDEPPANNKPLVPTEVAIRDLSAAVDFVLQRRKIDRVNLIGWSWGTTLVAGYAADNPGKVNRLALYAPVWIGNPPLKDGPKFDTAYRTVQREGAMTRWVAGVPENKKAGLIPAGWFDTWWEAAQASDPVGAKQTPPVLRAPNGTLNDIFTKWLTGTAMYDAAKITVPTIIVVAEWDQDTKPYMAQTLFGLLSNAPQKRLVLVGEGTHTLMLEKNRMALISAVQQFLEESFTN